ncbi:MAG: type II toxin-antitoxin system HicB family antitoxin [Opitutales bacterium]|jgi:predicted RNase H-like HicB family nuclease
MKPLEKYKQNAMQRAEIIPMDGGEGYVARIPGFKGLFATGETKTKARAELHSVLEGWIELSLRRGMGLPSVDTAERELVATR